MGAWKSYLNSDPTKWLLEEDNPSVRYFTLKDILDKPDNDLEVRKCQRKYNENRC